MKGDFSRSTFARRKHYRRVLMQQGRVEIDADGNEQVAIDDHISATTSYDVIGQSGYPLALLPDGKTAAGGFKIDVDVAAGGADLTISQGRMYVDGLLVENDADKSTLVHQPDWPLSPTATLADFHLINNSTYVVYLDVWERLVTALDDPLIQESALGGPDTSTRTKVVWQVKLLPVPAPEGGGPPTCASVGRPWLPNGTRGTLAALTTAASVDPVPCILPPETGFRRLENQLYRVEIHTAGRFGTATFKWSRENGSVVAGVIAPTVPTPPPPVQGPTFSVTSIGRDTSLGFKAGDWVELTDDRGELIDGHGELLQVKITPTNGTLTTTNVASAKVDPALHPKLRRWDQTGTGLEKGVPIVDGNSIELEDGVAIRFNDGIFEVGDYWLIPARTRTSIQQGHIEWPVDKSNAPLMLPPRGINHHYAELALVTFSGARFLSLGDGSDCRLPFPPLTALQPAEQTSGPCTIVVVPGPGWEKPIQALFSSQGPVDAEICFPVGTFPTTGLAIGSPDRPALGNIKVSGAGRGTRVIATGTESALSFIGCASVEVRDLYAETAFVETPDDPDDPGNLKLNGTLEFFNCQDVVVENVALKCGSGTLRGAACITVRHEVTVANADSGVGAARIRGSRLVVGQMQFGILLVHVERATVEDNQIDVERVVRPLPLVDRLRNPRFRAAAQQFLVSRASLTAPGRPVPPTPPAGPASPAPQITPAQPASPVPPRAPTPHPNVTVRVGNQTLSFQSQGGLQTTWQTYLDRHAQGNFATPRDALNFVKSAASRILTDPTERAGLAGFADVIRSLELTQVLPAARGIVVGGRTVRDLHITDNRISGALLAIAVGVSHAEEKAGPPDRAHTVTIRGNTIDVNLSTLALTHARCGIFVGNVDSLMVDNNRLILIPQPGVAEFPSDGIRVWGYLGKKMVVRDNYLTRFSTGVRVVAQTGVKNVVQKAQKTYQAAPQPGDQWLVADNAIDCSVPIVAPACMQTGNMTGPPV